MSTVLATGFNSRTVGYRTANEELRKLAEHLGSKLHGHFGWNFFGNEPRIDARYRGYDCRIYGMNHPWGGRQGSSVSCMVDLPRLTRHVLRWQNVESVRTTAWHNLELMEPKPHHDFDSEQMTRLWSPEDERLLQNTETPYAIILNPDRLTFTAFHLFEHSFYLRVLDWLTDVANQLMELE